MSNYDDVYDFHKKFGLIAGTKPQSLTKEKLKERVEFLFEEFSEFVQACGLVAVRNVDGDLEVFDIEADQDFAEQADALVDLVYVAMGTAVMMGLPWQQLWDDVHRANMSKARGVSHRGHAVDCIKPEGWVPPQGKQILNDHGYDPEANEVDDEHQ